MVVGIRLRRWANGRPEIGVTEPSDRAHIGRGASWPLCGKPLPAKIIAADQKEHGVPRSQEDTQNDSAD